MSFIAQVLTDLDLFLADFGESQSWTPAAGGAATAFTGIVENEYFDGSVVVPYSSSKPSIMVKTTAVAGIARGDTVTVTSTLHGLSSAAYKLEHKQDSPGDLGPGMSRLILKT